MLKAAIEADSIARSTELILEPDRMQVPTRYQCILSNRTKEDLNHIVQGNKLFSVDWRCVAVLEEEEWNWICHMVQHSFSFSSFED